MLRHIGEERFNEPRQFGELECLYPDWYLVVKKISGEQAIGLYGEISAEELGPGEGRSPPPLALKNSGAFIQATEKINGVIQNNALSLKL